MEHITKFEDHSGYSDFVASSGYVTPNVSLCEAEDELHYSPYDYSKDYLTFVALESGTISFDILMMMNTEMLTSISYSTDGGETWTTTNNVNNKEGDLSITVNVSAGDKVMWKGIAARTGCFDSIDEDEYRGSFFSSTARFNAYGNIMSLCYGDDFAVESAITIEGQFNHLFSDYYQNKTTLLVSAENLVIPSGMGISADYCYGNMFEYCATLVSAPKLPATTLIDRCYIMMFRNCTSLEVAPELPAETLEPLCYAHMFSGCTGLTTAPELPATTLADSCYLQMFRDCTSLTATPELPATTLAEYCYSNMFAGCINITTAPALPVTTLANGCYSNMFAGCINITTAPALPVTTLANGCYTSMFKNCTSLTTAPELPATTLATSCYLQMFRDCTSLVAAPELPATTLANGCYTNMFKNCTGLTKAPELPATTLANGCYQRMFSGCTSLVKAPELPAATLVNSCYSEMFYNCTSLNYIKCLATDISAGSCTKNWVTNVATYGTFVKANEMEDWTRGDNGIPLKWGIQNEKEPLMQIWIDDFPESDGDPYDDWSDHTMEDEARNPSFYGANLYVYYGDTVQYHGSTMYLWLMAETGYTGINNLLTTTADYNTLYGESIEDSTGNTFASYVGRFNDDFSDDYSQNEHEQFLVKVERPWSPLRIYTTKYPSDEDMAFGGKTYEYGNRASQMENEPFDSDCCSADAYEYNGETLEYGGVTYYLWQSSSAMLIEYMLTRTNNFNELFDQSLQAGTNRRFTALVGKLNNDKQMAYLQGESTEPGIDKWYLDRVEKI